MPLSLSLRHLCLALAVVLAALGGGGGDGEPTAADRLPADPGLDLSRSPAGAAPFAVGFAVTPGATVSGSRAAFTARATGSNPRFKWDFGDGSTETGWSTSPHASHAYAQPGLYTVTVTAADDRGVERRVATLQSVHLPQFAGTPSTTGSIAFESRSGGHPRLWVVNADADSVSVFDTVTRKRLAEIPVGDAPCTLALMGNRTVWVTNKADDSVSVIDTATLTVRRTLLLPPGSQPHGVAALNAGYALVVLEADGMLVRFSTSTYAPTGTLAIGANARHVSISADGGTAYVTRAIGAPEPGEATASAHDGRSELLHVALPALSIVRRIGLAEGGEDLAGRVDHVGASQASAVAFDPRGLFRFVAPARGREVAVIDAYRRRELFRIDTGLAPQGLALSADGLALYVHHLMARSVDVYDLRPLQLQGRLAADLVATLATIGHDRFDPFGLRVEHDDKAGQGVKRLR